MQQPSMKSLVYGGNNSSVKLVSKDVPISCRQSEVSVRVHASGLNPVDAKHLLGDKLPDSWTTARRFLENHVTKDHVIGLEFCGQVVSCPSGIYQPGDMVYGSVPPFRGTLAECIRTPLHHVALKPTSLTDVQAAALPLVGLTCIQALGPYQKTGCKSIAIIGASGGTGSVAIQVARCYGFTEIVAVCSSRNKEFVEQLGATRVVCYDTEDVVSGLANSSNGFDIIFDSVTSADPRDSGNQYPKKLMHLCNTRYLRLGGESPDWIRAGMEKATPFNYFGKEKLFWIRFPKSHEELTVLKQFCDGEGLTVKVSREVEFTAEAVQNAFDDLLDRRVQGKIAVKIAAS